MGKPLMTSFLPLSLSIPSERPLAVMLDPPGPTDPHPQQTEQRVLATETQLQSTSELNSHREKERKKEKRKPDSRGQ